MKFKLLATVAFFALTPVATMADAVDDRIQDLFSQGYTHFSVSRGARVNTITAYGASLPMLEVGLSSATGEVLSERSEGFGDADHSREISRIESSSLDHDGAEDGVGDSGSADLNDSHPETDSGTGDDSGTDGDSGTDHDSGTGTDSGSDHDSGTGTDSGTDSGTDHDSGTGHDSGSDSDSGSDHDSGSDSDGGSDHDSGSDSGSDSDGGQDD